MNQDFADRLARIQTTGAPVTAHGAQNLELIGQTRYNAVPSLDDLHPTKAHKTYDERFKMAVINNVILGFIWMAITGYVAANLFATADFFAGSAASDESIMNIKIGLGVALVVSFGLCYWVIREAMRDLGKVHGMPASLAVGCVLGVVAGAGPVTVFNLLVDMGYL